MPRCGCGGIVKPDVVLYEEGLDQRTLEDAVRALAAADLLIIGGTSLNVYPAAGLIRYFGGRHLVLINKSPVARDLAAELVITDPHRRDPGPAVSPSICPSRRPVSGHAPVAFSKYASLKFKKFKFQKNFKILTETGIENESHLW